MSVQHFWNLSQILGLFTCSCHKLANLTWNFVAETCKQHPETTRQRLCCKKLGTSHDVKGLAIGSFLECKCCWKSKWWKTLKMLVWSAQNRSISSEICPENNHKTRFFFTIAFQQSLPRKFLQTPAKSVYFSLNLSLKIPQNLTFFSATSQKPWRINIMLQGRLVIHVQCCCEINDKLLFFRNVMYDKAIGQTNFLLLLFYGHQSQQQAEICLCHRLSINIPHSKTEWS